ncbi:unnamed protein product [Chondrus crispus]|uniref:Uncharacterized protein n=1 Tax=Chondrus crispus TaxID=2769 RepID=R7QLH7_CHOCR|nr:unnamed protein product [Chondrus crispus]CDF38255.1 unnamed protein product [Chondrus crispus]|eukprot:XP_005718140.1 unnamed protein product [Chondrus crispus]
MASVRSLPPAPIKSNPPSPSAPKPSPTTPPPPKRNTLLSTPPTVFAILYVLVATTQQPPPQQPPSPAPEPWDGRVCYGVRRARPFLGRRRRRHAGTRVQGAIADYKGRRLRKADFVRADFSKHWIARAFARCDVSRISHAE